MDNFLQYDNNNEKRELLRKRYNIFRRRKYKKDRRNYKKIFKFVVVIFVVILLFFAGIKSKIFAGYYMPNINFIIEHSIKQNTKQYYERNIKDIQIIQKKEYSNSLYVLFEYIEDEEKKFDVYIYSKSNFGLFKAKTPSTSLTGYWRENDGIKLYEFDLIEDYVTDTRRTVVFVFGYNENNYKKVVLERYDEDGEKILSYVDINEGYFMKFIDLGIDNESRLQAYYEK